VQSCNDKAMEAMSSLCADMEKLRCMHTYIHTYLQSCNDKAMEAMSSLCADMEKLPGVSVSHWPWQDFKM
jgi:hypothetical protein